VQWKFGRQVSSNAYDLQIMVYYPHSDNGFQRPEKPSFLFVDMGDILLFE